MDSERQDTGIHPINDQHRDRAERFCRGTGVSLYTDSVRLAAGRLWMMGRKDGKPLLLIDDMPGPLFEMGFRGVERKVDGDRITVCECTAEHAEALRSVFPFTAPMLIGRESSFGFGDRLGNAGAAHLAAARSSDFRVVLAQQSIRELERTGRRPEEVLDAATWSAFRTSFTEGFGADADHLKTPDQVDRMMEAGYTMFTVDPGDHVQDVSEEAATSELKPLYGSLPWSELEDSPSDCLLRYMDQPVELGGTSRLNPKEREIILGMVKYGKVILHAIRMMQHLMDEYPDRPWEVELSVDETRRPTTPFQHYLIASELHRRGFRWVSLAPRFCGEFEKGIDFRGSLEQFAEEYRQHLAIARHFGNYKLSLHSGSDKFSVYRVISEIDRKNLHIKTAGTSYLEALRTVAGEDPSLFRQIARLSVRVFDEASKSYHISARSTDMPDLDRVPERKLESLLDQDAPRQILHVAYGEILHPESKGGRRVRESLMECLTESAERYETNLITHFNRHLEPFKEFS